MKKIMFGYYQTPISEIIIGKTEKGICWLGFMNEGIKGNGYDLMKKYFKNANFYHDDKSINIIGNNVMKAWYGGKEKEINIDLIGTSFQKAVWRALLNIKKGMTCSYNDIAINIGNPNALRAVGSAVGKNPVSLIIPCHRVIRKDGSLGNYGWGAPLKRKILELETK